MLITLNHNVQIFEKAYSKGLLLKKTDVYGKAGDTFFVGHAVWMSWDHQDMWVLPFVSGGKQYYFLKRDLEPEPVVDNFNGIPMVSTLIH